MTTLFEEGGVAQMVERSLSMREVPGSIPGASIPFMILYIMIIFCSFSGYVIINRTKKIRCVYTTETDVIQMPST